MSFRKKTTNILKNFKITLINGLIITIIKELVLENIAVEKCHWKSILTPSSLRKKKLLNMRRKSFFHNPHPFKDKRIGMLKRRK
jgi:hypothetical protein